MADFWFGCDYTQLPDPPQAYEPFDAAVFVVTNSQRVSCVWVFGAAAAAATDAGAAVEDDAQLVQSRMSVRESVDYAIQTM